MEEEWIGSGHLLNWRCDGDHIGIFLWNVSTGTRAHVTIFGRPRFEPVAAGWAASSVGGDFVEMEFDHEIAKGRKDVGASFLGAGQDVFAWGDVINGYCAVVRLEVLSLIASERLARDELGGREGVVVGSLGSASWVVLEDGVLCRLVGVGRVGRWGV